MTHNIGWSRRGVLAAGGSAALLGAAGCETVLPPAWRPGPTTGRGLIDVHCHLFNGQDLPTVRFLKQVVLKVYPREGVRVMSIDDPDVVDGLLALLTFIVGKTRAPTARQEIAVLDAQAVRRAENGDGAENRTAVLAALSEAVQTNQIAVSGEMSPNAFFKVREALFKAAGAGPDLAVNNAPLSPEEAAAIAQRAYESPFDIGLLLRWFSLFTRYRHVLADELARTHEAQGPEFRPRLLCPAMIDYDFWLDEYIERSPLPDQVDVMGRLSRRAEGAVVHGYVAFDPLRQARWDFDQAAGGTAGSRAQFDPIALIERAVRDEGFIGAKLYPPMGFKPFANASDVCQIYPERVVKAFGPAGDDPATAVCAAAGRTGPRPMDGSVEVSRRLDAAMTRFFDTCSRLKIGVIAHAGDSVQSGDGFGARADPAFWLPVFRRWPDVPVMLAHFGGFSSHSAAEPPGSRLPEASWEWTVGRHIADGDPPVFCDLSYLTEIAHRTPEETTAYAAVFRQWIDTFDPECRHLAFGTDWIMVGLDDAYEGYTARTQTFLRDACGLDEPRLRRIFFGNAARFAGLRQGDATLERLRAFYAAHKIPDDRLPAFEAV